MMPNAQRPTDDVDAPAHQRRATSPQRGHSFVSLIVRDPDWAFVTWEVTPHDVDAAARAVQRFSARTRLTLRLYQTPPCDPRAHDIDVSAWLGTRYVLLGRPGATHAAAVGLHTPDGLFHAIARSAWVRAPRSDLTSPQPPRFGATEQDDP